MQEWNYKSLSESSSGYEDVIDKLKSYTKEKYINSTEEIQQQMIEDVFQIYRGKNIFPITYYNDTGIINEIQKCLNKDIKWDGDVLNLKFNQGSSLCKYLFPNLMKVDVKNTKNNSMYERFYNDHKLKRAIKFCFEFDTAVTPTKIQAGLRMIGGGVASNYKAMNAKALYERYCPPDGIIYDYACGFGGRMLGALTSKNNYRYFGVEPCIETYGYLHRLGLYIERATGRQKIFKVYCMGSEDCMVKENYIDFAFSSPPYFNLEKYSDEPTQCYNKFPELELWFDGYVRPTIENIYKMLKPDRYYAVNIADFNLGSKKVKYVDKWISISEETGFKFVEQIYMKLQTRRGYGHKESGKDIEKKEGIFVFQK